MEVGGGGEISRGIRQLSWTEMLAHARRCKAHAKAAAGPGASWGHLTTAQVAGRPRLYGLGIADPRRGEQVLLFADMDAELIWRPLLGWPSAGVAEAALTKEEELRLERMRCTFRGLTSFALDAAHGALLFPADSGLFLAHDGGPAGVQTSRLLCPAGLTPLEPVACPSRPDLVAFVAHGDVYAVRGTTNLRLTHYGDDKLSEPPARFAGSPSYIIQEEFDRYTGMWFCPKSQADGSELLLYEDVDETGVSLVEIGVSGSRRADEVETMRYPLAGTDNAKTTLKLARIHMDADGLSRSESLGLATELCKLFPWAEYIPRAGWVPGGGAVWAQLLSRAQDRLVLVHVPVSAFLGAADAVVSVLMEERSQTWVNVGDLLHFLPSSDPGVATFLWGSERSGFDHFYKVGTTLAPKGEAGPVFGPTSPGWRTQESQITSGDWTVKRKIEPTYDEGRGLIFFLGLKDSPIESHVYAVSYLKPELGVGRLTELGRSACAGRAVRDLAIDSASGYMAVSESSLESPSSTRVYRITYGDCLPTATPIGYLSAPTPPTNIVPETAATAKPGLPFSFSLHDHPAPRLFSYKGSRTGMDHYGLLFLPPASFPEKTRRPVLLYVYGGPEVQLVKNQWSSAMGMAKFTALGYAVLMLDGRGSANRGLAWEGLVKGSMGQEEAGDQVEGLQAVVAQTGDLLDPTRVAVAGWSYGGFLSLWSIIQYPEIFKVAMAGGPVTDYRLYDTGYTERYMGLPGPESAAYGAADVTAVAGRLPKEKGRLLLLHGGMDENVHLKHTWALVQAAMEAGRPYDVQVFPKERHGIRAAAAADHLDAAQMTFLQSAAAQGLY